MAAFKSPVETFHEFVDCGMVGSCPGELNYMFAREWKSCDYTEVPDLY
jgi:hypothetical protein